jgi:undecaprenyl-diphosphatase
VTEPAVHPDAPAADETPIKFGPLAHLLDHRIVAQVDLTAERLAAPLRAHPTADRVFHALTELGDHSIIWHCIALTQGLLGDDLAVRRAVRLLASQGIEAAIVNGPVKSLFRRKRPVLDQPRTRALRQPRTSSFPSGHASAAACATVMLCDGASLPAKVGWTGLGLAVAWSRVHVRVHHGSDILAGYLIGLGLGAAARRVVPLS